MFRKDLIEMLHGNPMTVSQIARLVDESPGRVADDLNHLLRSLKHTEYKAVVEPARCGTSPLSLLRVRVFKREIKKALQMP